MIQPKHLSMPDTKLEQCAVILLNGKFIRCGVKTDTRTAYDMLVKWIKTNGVYNDEYYLYLWNDNCSVLYKDDSIQFFGRAKVDSSTCHIFLSIKNEGTKTNYTYLFYDYGKIIIGVTGNLKSRVSDGTIDVSTNVFKGFFDPVSKSILHNVFITSKEIGNKIFKEYIKTNKYSMWWFGW